MFKGYILGTNPIYIPTPHHSLAFLSNTRPPIVIQIGGISFTSTQKIQAESQNCLTNGLGVSLERLRHAIPQPFRHVSRMHAHQMTPEFLQLGRTIFWSCLREAAGVDEQDRFFWIGLRLARNDVNRCHSVIVLDPCLVAFRYPDDSSTKPASDI